MSYLEPPDLKEGVGCGVWGSGEVGKWGVGCGVWGSGEVGKWGSGEVGCRVWGVGCGEGNLFHLWW
ncbi:hypothetical protein [Microcystis panniformis]|uniref:hypothetical protein n=1 Tax=Microcystis panniformis TaxID=513223 RepID=UPI00068F59EB|nr:hypothetical protein [Microcystis panniformis]